MNNLFLILEFVQALVSISILMTLVVILIQTRAIAQGIFSLDLQDAGVENPDAQEPQRDYTNTGESLADILNKRLEQEFGDDYLKYMQKPDSYELENDFGITGVEVITDEDEVKPTGEK